MANLFIGQVRRDGKFPVTFVYAHGTRLRKVLTRTELHEAVEKHGDERQKAQFPARRSSDRAAEASYLEAMEG